MITRDEDGRFPAYAWPGGYPVFYLCDDGGTLCPDCVNDPANPVHEDAPADGWRLVDNDVNWEDEHLHCDHCNARIPSAYGDGEEG